MVLRESGVRLQPPELEHGYRSANLDSDRSRALLLVAISVLTEAALGVAALFTATALPNAWIIQLSRLVIIPTSLVFGWIIRRQTTPAGLDTVVSSWVFAFVIYTLVDDALYPPSYFTTALWDMIIILVVYTVMPMPLQAQIAAALLLTLGSAVSLQAVRMADLSAYLTWSVLATYGVANVVGYAVGVTSKRRRRHEYKLFVAERNEREQLEKALEEIKTLQGMLPLCSYCKRVRNDKGYWDQVDQYLSKHTPATVSHALCPDCLAKQYPKVYERLKREGKVP